MGEQQPSHYARTQGAVDFKSGIDARWAPSFYSRSGARDPVTNELCKSAGVRSGSSVPAARYESLVPSETDAVYNEERKKALARIPMQPLPPPAVKKKEPDWLVDLNRRLHGPGAPKRPRSLQEYLAMKEAGELETQQPRKAPRLGEPARDGLPPGLTELVRDGVPAAAAAAVEDPPPDCPWRRLAARLRLRELLSAFARGGVLLRLAKQKLFWDEFKLHVGIDKEDDDCEQLLKRAVFNASLPVETVFNPVRGADETLEPGRAEIERLQKRENTAKTKMNDARNNSKIKVYRESKAEVDRIRASLDAARRRQADARLQAPLPPTRARVRVQRCVRVHDGGLEKLLYTPRNRHLVFGDPEQSCGSPHMKIIGSRPLMSRRFIIKSLERAGFERGPTAHWWYLPDEAHGAAFAALIKSHGDARKHYEAPAPLFTPPPKWEDLSEEQQAVQLERYKKLVAEQGKREEERSKESANKAAAKKAKAENDEAEAKRRSKEAKAPVYYAVDDNGNKDEEAAPEPFKPAAEED